MSKKQSSISGLLDPPPTILLDENLSSPDIAAELRRWESEWSVELHKDHFPDPRTPDPEILKTCGERGWIIISVDDRMRRISEYRKVAEKYGARVFTFPKSYATGAEYRAALTAGRHKLLKLAKKMPPPNFARITKEGNAGFFDRDKLAKTATSVEKTAAKYPDRGIIVRDEEESA
jgi:hypothetical protein